MESDLRLFGEYLSKLRREAGFESLESVVTKARRISSGAKGLSRSMLSLYERGELGSANLEVLRQLAKIYRVPERDLLARWVKARYGIGSVSNENSIVRFSDSTSCSLIPRAGAEEPLVKLISLDRFRHEQGELPKGTRIAVAAMGFLDDSVFYEIARNNIKRGIEYIYLIPIADQAAYRAFVRKVEHDEPRLAGRVDGKLTHYFPRANLDFPCNQVLYLFEDGSIQGYIGLLHGKVPQFFQVSDQETSFRMLQGFQWAFAISEDGDALRRLASLQFEVEKSPASAKNLVRRDRSSSSRGGRS